MTTFPVCKVNLGLYVTSKRPDGMHNLSTVFLPVSLCDTLEIVALNDTYSADILHLTGLRLTEEGTGADNLVMRTIASLREDYPELPYFEVWLHKRIPTGAGLGGGSSDAAYTLRLINEMCDLRISDTEAIRRLSVLGADCAFFWKSTPAYAEGIGEELHPIALPQLKGLFIVLVKPPFGVSTREAFGGITPRQPALPLREALARPIGNWKTLVGNDFETTVFPHHPELKALKQTLYDASALYAQMSGSGSTMLAFFKRPVDEEIRKLFPNYFIHSSQL